MNAIEAKKVFLELLDTYAKIHDEIKEQTKGRNDLGALCSTIGHITATDLSLTMLNTRLMIEILERLEKTDGNPSA